MYMNASNSMINFVSFLSGAGKQLLYTMSFYSIRSSKSECAKSNF